MSRDHKTVIKPVAYEDIKISRHNNIGQFILGFNSRVVSLFKKNVTFKNGKSILGLLTP
jgi:hypothetical protein